MNPVEEESSPKSQSDRSTDTKEESSLENAIYIDVPDDHVVFQDMKEDNKIKTENMLNILKKMKARYDQPKKDK